ncbi:MAG TPA: LysR substrate-binding domain-containing protein [Candidatus Binatia bacterium]|jgi:LysR family hydrogen peroxide-inducible transcriptional activator
MNFNPHLVTLRQLQYIVAVAECLSFNRAAEECHVSQPSLSAQIAEVERLLGVRLFERDNRRVLLTAAGREFIQQARAVLRESDALAEAARRFVDPLSGTLRFGVIPTISPYFLPRLTPKLRAAFPALKVVWLEEKTRALTSRLEAGEIDAALVAFEADLGEVHREAIGKDPFVLLTARGHPLAADTAPLKLSELRNNDVWILTDDHCFGKQALELCLSARARDNEFKATSLATIVSMVAGGAGVTLLPELSVPHEVRIRNLRVRRFADPAPGRTIGLVWRKNSSLGPALRKVAAAMRDAYPE